MEENKLAVGSLLRKGIKSQTRYPRTSHRSPGYNHLETQESEFTGLPDMNLGVLWSHPWVTADTRDELHGNLVQNRTEYSNNKEWFGVCM